jgi:hypothetical protein
LKNNPGNHAPWSPNPVGRVKYLKNSQSSPEPARLDNRLGAVKRFDAIVANIAADLGNNLTTAQLEVVEAFAGVTIAVQDQNARLLLGQDVDLQKHAAAVSMLTQLAQFIGLVRDHETTVGDALLKVATASRSKMLEA